MPLALFPVDHTLSLSTKSLRALFVATAAPPGVDPERLEDRLAVAAALWGDDLPLPLATLLAELGRLLAFELLRFALDEAARDRRLPREGWDDEPVQELVLRLLLAARADPVTYAPFFERVHRRLSRLLPDRPTYELVADSPRRVGSTANLAAAMAAVAGEGFVAFWTVEEPDGTLHGTLVYRSPRTTVPAIGPGGRTLLVTMQPVLADAFAYFVEDGRLSITTSLPPRLTRYARAFGEGLHDDPAFFSERPSVTHKPIQELGNRPLPRAALPEGIQDGRVVACTHDTGSGTRIEARGKEPLGALASAMKRGGYLPGSTLRFNAVEELWPVDAVFGLPYRVSIGGGAGVTPAGRKVRKAIGNLGIFSPGTQKDDLSTLLPLQHPDWRFSEIAGDQGMARMRERGLFKELAADKTRRAAGAAFRRVARSAVAFPLTNPHEGRKDSYYAIAEDWAIPAVTVHAADMVMLKLLLPKLAESMRRDLGLDRGAVPKAIAGVLWIGELRLPSGAFCVFFLLRAAKTAAEKRALGNAIAAAAGFRRPVVMVPATRGLGQSLMEVELSVGEQLGAVSVRGRMEEIARALGVVGEIPVERLVAEDVRLIVDTRRKVVILDGVVLQKLGGSGFALVLFLAKRPGEVVSTEDSDRALSGKRESDGATRNAVWKMRATIRTSFEEAGKALDEDGADPVRAIGRKGWTLVVKAAVV